MISRTANAPELPQSADIQLFDAVLAYVQMREILFTRTEIRSSGCSVLRFP